MAETRTLPELLARLVTMRGDEPWIVDPVGAAAAATFARRVDRIAAELASRDVGRGDRVAAFLEHGIDLAAAPFACARLGALSVLVNPKAKDAQVRHIVEDAAVRAVLTSETKVASLKGEHDAFGDRCIVHTERLSGEAPVDAVAVAPSEAATILYTSGSTGRPKGIVQSHGSLCDGARIVAGYLDLRPDDQLMAVLPLSFDYGLNQVLSAAWAGCRVTLHPYFLAAELARELVSSRATGLAGVPELWVDLIDALDRGAVPLTELAALRYVTNSGGRLPQRVIEWFHARLPKVEVFSMYGLTEAFRSSFVPPHELRARPRSIGRAIPEVELYVVDPQTGRLAAPGEVGELVHAGALVADGYWQRPADTAQRFRPHPVRGAAGGMAVWSGDLARIDADGYLELCGRADAQIKVGAFRVSPDEVVEVIATIAGVRTAAAVGVPRGQDGLPVLAVAVVPRADADRERLPERIRAACRAQLPTYLVPAEVHLLDSLPLTPNHKVDHSALRAQLAGEDAHRAP